MYLKVNIAQYKLKLNLTTALLRSNCGVRILTPQLLRSKAEAKP